ncbi:PAS domain-containing sensor histidine kinase [Aneurinibacillus aneurinilyticus]|uniref:Oxygen sensor histidine kinase NreB n=1 Tax=Aneurinibacillus aneurinilyticus ATCC 12856 TaxID=649747 RepID=U1WTB4_ANEAE|nr:PAS domain-containing sensor histidine kinase [Aneurinibacillus aneurinilyticus]ERI05905.1 PAS domain S-box protein [Aneurinibacillus aneurinilyticus ATCC 12856]MED0708578.1 PAS domain-containing sensor histidine kinase [Aneurinibacillus aneurinilyticus]MED0721738.1 PAS domain-containing sensor histidine kinase [Aneurinibacillus aneurinilyticus]MED0731862.1 PAS domain-containing sensor histidine kinase [Aneurinibacillus aneurinilyticus]MED0740557.1 PAS domain-containing sensor histidine kin
MLEHMLFQALSDGVLIMDRNRIIQEINPAATRMTGWETGHKVPYCLFCQYREVEHDEERCLLMGKNAPSYFESEMPTLYGESIPVSFSTTYLPAEDGTVEHTLLMLRDISQKKQEEEARMAKLLARQTIEAQEAERKRLAQELHDGIGQSLYSISMALGLLRQIVPESGTQLFATASATLADTMREVKQLSVTLRPPALDILGLKAALVSLIRQMEQHFSLKITMRYKLPLGLRMSSSMELHIYRIVQEILSNAAKHAKSPVLFLSLRPLSNRFGLRLTIRDKGKGFDPIHVYRHSTGLGLKHLAERTKLLQGSMHISSAPGRGTVLRFVIPFTSTEETDNEKN